MGIFSKNKKKEDIEEQKKDVEVEQSETDISDETTQSEDELSDPLEDDDNDSLVDKVNMYQSFLRGIVSDYTLHLSLIHI